MSLSLIKHWRLLPRPTTHTAILVTNSTGMPFEALATGYPSTHTAFQPLTGLVRVPARTSYATVAVDRLCGKNGMGGCPVTLLCSRCGSNQTLTVSTVSRKQDGDSDDRVMEDNLLFNTTPISERDDGSRLLVPSTVIVLEAAAVIRASQCEAVMPGVGLHGPLRPLQGPVCAGCKCLSEARWLSKKVEATSFDDEMDSFGLAAAYANAPVLISSLSSLPTSPRDMTSINSSEFKDRHDDLLCDMRGLGLQSALQDLVSGTPVSKKKKSAAASRKETTVSLLPVPRAGGFMLSTCACGSYTDSTMDPCVRNYQVPLVPTLQRDTLKESTHNSCVVFGHMRASVEEKWKVYEIWIVDTRMQSLCHLRGDGIVEEGVVGQIIYNNPSSRCDRKPLAPPSGVSCFVCCTLLDAPYEVNIPVRWSISNSRVTSTTMASVTRQSNVYVPAHVGWAHKECVVACEKSIIGVCEGSCARLNTSVDVSFDLSPRFENVCPTCITSTAFSATLLATLPTAIAVATSMSSSSSTTGSSFRKRALPPVPLFQNTSKSISKSTSKSASKSASKFTRPGAGERKGAGARQPPAKCTGSQPAPGNWLSDASSVKKQAVQALNGGEKQKEWVRDLSGIYNDKVNGTWYTLDANGMNPAPVCGQPFFDPYFHGIRNWTTLGEREQAIESHKRLLEMGAM